MEKNSLNKAEAPAYKGNGVSIWKAKDKNGNQYLRVKVLNSLVCCFPIKKKK